jgi:hypothetical protein
MWMQVANPHFRTVDGRRYILREEKGVQSAASVASLYLEESPTSTRDRATDEYICAGQVRPPLGCASSSPDHVK